MNRKAAFIIGGIFRGAVGMWPVIDAARLIFDRKGKESEQYGFNYL